MENKNKIGRFVILGIFLLILLGGITTVLYGLAGGI